MTENILNFFKKRYLLVIFLLFAFILIVRIIPEYLIGPTPIGYDSSQAYITSYLLYNGSFLSAIQNFSFLYFIFEILRKTGLDALIAIKIVGPLIYLSLSIAFFLILKDTLKFSRKFTLLGTFLFALQLCTLRFSWDLYRNELALVFALLCIWLVSKFMEEKKIWQLPLILLTAILVIGTHQMVSFLLAVVTILGLLVLIISRKPSWKWLYWLIGAVIIFVWPFAAQHVTIHGFSLWQALDPQNLALYLLPLDLFKLLFFPFFFVFSVIGIIVSKKRPLLLLITLFIFVQSMSMIVFKTGGFFLWDRWMYFLGIPLAIYALEGIRWTVRTFAPKITIHRAYITGFIVILTIAPTLQFLWPQRTLYGANVNRTIFNLFPGSILSNAFIANSYEKNRAKNLLPCLEHLNANYDNLPITYPGNYQAIAYYALPNARNRPPTTPNSPYYVINYIQPENAELAPAFPDMPDCPIFIHPAITKD